MQTLPALKSLGKLADVTPIIVIDSREQTPLQFTRLAIQTKALQSGDYSIAGCENLFAVERKTIADLVGCCMGEHRDRFFRELHRLRGFKFKRLVIIGSMEEIESGIYWSSIKPRAVLATLSALEVRFDIPVVFFSTPAAAALKIESWAFWFARELVVTTNDLARGTGVT